MISKDFIDLIAASEIEAAPTLSDRLELAKRCHAIVPLNWPDGGLVEMVGHVAPADGQFDRRRSYWYALARDASTSPIAPLLVGGGAIALAPNGMVACMSFSVLPQLQGHRYGESIARGLVDWVFGCTQATRISVRVPWSDAARVHVLAKIGFVVLDDDAGSRSVAEFVLRRGEAGFGPRPVS